MKLLIRWETFVHDTNLLPQRITAAKEQYQHGPHHLNWQSLTKIYQEFQCIGSFTLAKRSLLIKNSACF